MVIDSVASLGRRAVAVASTGRNSQRRQPGDQRGRLALVLLAEQPGGLPAAVDVLEEVERRPRRSPAARRGARPRARGWRRDRSPCGSRSDRSAQRRGRRGRGRRRGRGGRFERGGCFGARRTLRTRNASAGDEARRRRRGWAWAVRRGGSNAASIAATRSTSSHLAHDSPGWRARRRPVTPRRLTESSGVPVAKYDCRNARPVGDRGGVLLATKWPS